MSEPPAVREATAWLRDHPIATWERVAAVAPVALFFAGFPMAGLVATAAGSEPVGAIGLLAMWGLSVAASLGIARIPEVRNRTWALGTLATWERVRSLGEAAPFAVEPDADDPIGQMAARVAALAGAGPLADAAVRVRDRAAELTRERAHLDQARTGAPDADAVLLAAREGVERELLEIRVRLAEAWAALLARGQGEGSASLDEALGRLEAEQEVDRLDRGRRASRATEAAGQQR